MLGPLSLPFPVATLLRRLANVVSVLSISNQYFGTRAAQLSNNDGCKSDPGPLYWAWLSQKITRTFSKDVRTKEQGPSSEEINLRLHTSEFSDVEKHTSSTLSLDQPPIEGSSLRISFPVHGAPNHTSNTSTISAATVAHEATEAQKLDTIHRLIRDPVLRNPVRTPRNPIALCHGLHGFDVRGPSAWPRLQMHYWSNVLNILKKTVGAQVIVTSVPSTGSVSSRSENLNHILTERAKGQGINFMAHSMGGLDCRHLISHIRPTEYRPLSLTSVATPHRGSPFMDWCAEYIGIGRLRLKERSPLASGQLSDPAKAESAAVQKDAHEPPPPSPSPLSLSSFPSSFTTFLLSILDSPAYSNLTSTYLNKVFNPETPDDPHVKYFSVAGRIHNVPIWHPFWLPKMVLDGVEQRERERLRKEGEELLRQRGQTREDLVRQEGALPLWEREDEWGNDGLVSIQSARWGEFLGIMEGADHWELRGARGIELDIDLPSVSFGEGWNLSDWGKWMHYWRKEEKKAEDKRRREGQRNVTTSAIETAADLEARAKEKKEDADARAHSDAVIKASTDKLSAVFDWLAEQIPTPAKAVHPLSSSGKEKTRLADQKKQIWKQKEAKRPEKSELEKKEDLEIFYIALSRKLYDEGL